MDAGRVINILWYLATRISALICRIHTNASSFLRCMHVYYTSISNIFIYDVTLCERAYRLCVCGDWTSICVACWFGKTLSFTTTTTTLTEAAAAAAAAALKISQPNERLRDRRSLSLMLIFGKCFRCCYFFLCSAGCCYAFVRYCPVCTKMYISMLYADRVVNNAPQYSPLREPLMRCVCNMKCKIYIHFQHVRTSGTIFKLAYINRTLLLHSCWAHYESIWCVARSLFSMLIFYIIFSSSFFCSRDRFSIPVHPWCMPCEQYVEIHFAQVP